MSAIRFGLANGASVEVLELVGSFRGDFGRTRWPCLGCGQRRPVHEACTVVVQDVEGPPMPRHIILCQECLDGRLPPAHRQPAAS